MRSCFLTLYIGLAAIALAAAAGTAAAQKATREFGTYKASEFGKSDLWINGGPLTLKSVKGKVTVLDFWAFDCEPCIQAMPHVVGLYEKYAKDGLVVIGIHTPRADNEKDAAKLREAIDRMGIRFPVAVDAKQKLWRDYKCELWPSQFVIDRRGIVRFSHGGVGKYDDMDAVVRKLLDEK